MPRDHFSKWWLQVWRYLSTLWIPQGDPIDLVYHVARADKLVDICLTARDKVKDEDTPTEVPDRQRETNYVVYQ